MERVCLAPSRLKLVELFSVLQVDALWERGLSLTGHTFTACNSLHLKVEVTATKENKKSEERATCLALPILRNER